MSLGIGQVLILLIIVFVIFGAGKLPKVMGDLAKGLRSFKDGMNEDKNSPKDKPVISLAKNTSKKEVPRKTAAAKSSKAKTA